MSSNPLKRPRQDPVSCRFCRSKKLKCNRESPCSNCAARGLECENRSSNSQPRLPSETDAPNASVLERLKRLEDVVLGPFHSYHIPSVPPPTTSEIVPQSKPTSPWASAYEEVVQSLEDTGTRDTNSWLGSRFQCFTIQILPISEIAALYLRRSSGYHGQTPLTHFERRCFYLPSRTEANVLLDVYVHYIDSLQHVIYLPHMTKMMDDIYSKVQDAEQLVSGQLALLLTILASAAAIYQYFPTQVPPEISEAVASHASLFWTNAALEMLDISRRIYEGRIEDIQATILLSFLMYHLEGPSVRTRGLFHSALCIARDLSLHRLDGSGNQSSGIQTCEDRVHAEIKRRVIWHAVATDWLLALSGGPQQGTYTMQPRHLQVKWPRNVDDHNLGQDPEFDQPLSSPSTMSYHLQRIKLADLCRSVADTIPLLNVDISTIDYKEIIALDRRFETLLEELPSFMKIDEHNRRRSEEIMLKYPQMRVQRFSLAMITLTRRCKLHQPFLIRGSVHKEYTYSREVSLNSARSVIKMTRVVERDAGTLFSADVRLTGISHHIFMATIVLVTDLCFNRGGDDDEERKVEVIEALKILGEAKCRSRIVSKFVESLESVLRKHKVRLLNQPRPGNDDDRLKTDGDQPLLNPPPTGNQIGFVPEPWDSLEDPMSYPSEIDSVWRDYVQLGPNLQMPEWDSLFSDLDSTFH